MFGDDKMLDSETKQPDLAGSQVLQATLSVVPEVTLKRNISTWALVGLGIEILNGWMSIGSTVAIGLAQGGTVTVLYGFLWMTFVNGLLAATLAEMASAMPSAGGQYVWSSILASPSNRRAVSFATGCVSICAWCVTSASVYTTLGQYIMAMAQLWHPSLLIQRWHVFLLYIATLGASVAWNCFVTVRTPWLGIVFIYFSTAVFIAILATVLATAPSFQSSTAVWATYTNEIGWESAFVVVATGLINPAYVFLGLDVTVHIADDSKDPGRDVPLALGSSVISAFITAFATGIALSYAIQDYAAAAASPVPFLTIVVQATSSRLAGTMIHICATICFFIAGNACIQATSRLIWSFACDDAIPFSKRIRVVHPTLRVPVLAIFAAATPVALIAFLYLGSTIAYNSIVATAIILSYVSFSIPTVCLLLRGRKMNEQRWLKLGNFGWFANIATVAWTAFSGIMWLFPLEKNPSALSMNYACAVIGILALVCAADWFFYARHHFNGPTQDELVTKLANELLMVRAADAKA